MGTDEFEEIIRYKVVGDSSNALMSEEGMTLEKAAYDSRLAMLDELRERSLAKRFQLGENTAESTSTKTPMNPEKIIRKGSLVRLRRLAQDNQHSHKMEPRWEDLRHLKAHCEIEKRLNRLKDAHEAKKEDHRVVNESENHC